MDYIPSSDFLDLGDYDLEFLNLNRDFHVFMLDDSEPITSSLPTTFLTHTSSSIYSPPGGDDVLHEFDIDAGVGFMPHKPPLTRLPLAWEVWEITLENGISSRLQPATKKGLTDKARKRSEQWRETVRELPILSTDNLEGDEILRRAHHVLTMMMHIYVNTIPVPSKPNEIHIPCPISIPLLRVCSQLRIPPILTYSDVVLYNWAFKVPPTQPVFFLPKSELRNLRCLSLFTGTPDEEEFYLASARVELRGIEALSIIRAIMGWMPIDGEDAERHIAHYLGILAGVVGDMATLLAGVRNGCEPETFWGEIRLWFMGQDPNGPKWVFDGIAEEEQPRELSGPSAGQTSLIQAIDIFLGIHAFTHRNSAHNAQASLQSVHSLTPTPLSEVTGKVVSFLERMQLYMPSHHRAFLVYLETFSHPLREQVKKNSNVTLRKAYNDAITALRDFRNKHVKIISEYVDQFDKDAPGTGGTKALRFVTFMRDQTDAAKIPLDVNQKSVDAT